MGSFVFFKRLVLLAAIVATGFFAVHWLQDNPKPANFDNIPQRPITVPQDNPFE